MKFSNKFYYIKIYKKNKINKKTGWLPEWSLKRYVLGPLVCGIKKPPPPEKDQFQAAFSNVSLEFYYI